MDTNVASCAISNNNINNDDEKQSIHEQKDKFSNKCENNVSTNIINKKRKKEKEKTEICLNGAEDIQSDEVTITEALQRFFGHDVSQRIDNDC